MKITVTGDFNALARFKDQIARTPASLPVISEQLAEETIELIREGFETQTDPYGKPWAKHSALTRRIRPGGHILEDDGHLKAGWHKRFATAQKFGVGNPLKTAAWAQRGTGIYGPRRQRITARNGRYLRIPVPGGAVFRHSVAGSPARRMVPSRSVLPARWSKRYAALTLEVLTELYRG